MSEKMTPEEYILEAGWVRVSLSSGEEFYRKNGQRLTLDAAVDHQLELDRARMAFVLDRSVGSPAPRSIDPGFAVPIERLLRGGK